MKYILVTSLMAVLLFACNKEEDEVVCPNPVAETASIRLMFDHAYDSTLITFTEPFVTDSLDTLTIKSLQYIISDVVFIDAEGGKFEEPNSYHIVSASPIGERWGTLIDSVPVGSYTFVSFRLGIAQNVFSDLTLLEKNHSQVEIDEMLKEDQSGYYNLKIEADYSTNGGLTGDVNIDNQSMTQSVEYEFGEAMGNMRLTHVGEPGGIDIHVVQDSITQVHFQANLNMLFDMPVKIDLDKSSHLIDLNALIHNNYSNGLFMLHHTKFE